MTDHPEVSEDAVDAVFQFLYNRPPDRARKADRRLLDGIEERLEVAAPAIAAKAVEEWKERYGYREGEDPLELQEARAGLEGLPGGIDLHAPDCGIPHPADRDQGDRGCTCGVERAKQRFVDAVVESLDVVRAQAVEEKDRQLLECEEALRSAEAKYAQFREDMTSELCDEGRSIETLSWDQLLGVANRNANEAMRQQARAEKAEQAVEAERERLAHGGGNEVSAEARKRFRKARAKMEAVHPISKGSFTVRLLDALEKAEAERDQAIQKEREKGEAGGHVARIEYRGGPPITWKEDRDNVRKAAFDRRREGKELLARAEKAEQAVEAKNAEIERLRIGVGALVVTSYCLKQPKYKYEPWDGPCGSCAPCVAKAAYNEPNAYRPRILERQRERADQVEAERDSISESYDRMKVARTEALRERDQAIQKERERWEKRNEKTGLTAMEDAFLGRFTDAMMEDASVIAILDAYAPDGCGYSVKTANRMREALSKGFEAALAALQEDARG